MFAENGWHAIQAKALAPRPAPDARSSVVRADDAEGKLYSIDVDIHDLGDELPKGASKTLRVIEGVAATAERPGVRRILGEVPLAADGSYQVQVPANTPVQLQLLDADGLRVRTSAWLWVRNHAAQGCVGCHEDPERTPPNRFMKALAAPAPVAEPAAAEPGGAPVARRRGTTPPSDRARCRAVRPGDRRRRTADDGDASALAAGRLLLGRARRRSRQALLPPPRGPARRKLPVFTDVTAPVRHHLDRSFGDHDLSNIVEGTGSGACVFDYDGDGRLDIYFPQGRWEKTVSDNRGRELIAQLGNALYRNKGGFKFEDVTEQAGVAGPEIRLRLLRRGLRQRRGRGPRSSSPTRAPSSITTRGTARSPK